MRIALLCATRRGERFLCELAKAAPDAELAVFSFREEPWEPPFLDGISGLANELCAGFVESKSLLRDPARSAFEDFQPDLLFMVSWRYMVPEEIYRQPRLGAYVFHDSLLPAYRGFSPTVWAIINGETTTGVTLFRCAADVDAGLIVDQMPVPIRADDTIAQTLEAVTTAYLDLLRENLPALMAGSAQCRPQDHSQATYTCKLTPNDVEIDWSAPSASVYNLVRAYTRPYPGAYTFVDGTRLTVWRAKRVADPSRYVGRVPGRVVKVIPGEGTVVLTGDGAIVLTEVQKEGQEAMPATEALSGLSMTLGRRGRVVN